MAMRAEEPKGCQRHQLPRRAGDARHDERLLHLVRQLGGQQRPRSSPTSPRASAASPYFNINTTYYNGAGTHVTNAVTYAGSTDDNYSLGRTSPTRNIQSIVAVAINGGSLPKDTNAVYFVLTSADVNATSGFCTQYCGWHTHGTIGGCDIKYSFIGNPTLPVALVRSGPRVPTATRAPTEWRRSSPTSWRRR